MYVLAGTTNFSKKIDYHSFVENELK